MDRRNVLKSVASVAVGAGLVAAGAETVSARGAKTRASTAKIPRRPFIETKDGTSLFYKDWGAGKPVVFVIGTSLTSDAWQYQMTPMVGAGLRCIAYDRRGHGRSSQPGHGYDYDTLADDLATVIEQLDLREVTLVAQSMGGGEVVRYLSRHGSGRIARIALLCPTSPFMLKTADNPDGIPREVFDTVRADSAKDFAKWCADISGAYFTPETSPQMKDWVRTLALQTSLLAVIQLTHTFSETDFRAELPKITVPTLLIHGEKDVFVPLDLTARRTAQLIPGAQLKVYEGAPHGIMFTHIDRLNGDLLAFVKG